MKRYATESTTQFIRRRVRHWKTTLCGIVTILGPFAIAIFPKYAVQIGALMSVATGSGLIMAADAKPAPETKT